MRTEFQEQQFENIYPKGIEKHYWNNSRNIHIKNKLRKLGLKSEAILEIGCGRGVVVNYLRENLINCTGVELAENPIDDNCEHLLYGMNAFELPETFRKNITVILLLDVIEHIEAPINFLDQVKKAFPLVEYYLITVPARQEIWSNFDEFNNHFLRYNKKNIVEHTSILKGEIIYLSYLFRLLYFPARILKYLGKDRETIIKAPKSTISKVIHKVLTFWFVLENKFILPGVPGTSLMTIIKTKPSAV